MNETLRPARPALHPVPAPAGTRPGLRPGVRPGLRPGLRPGGRPVPPPPVDPWQWHEYANRVAMVERSAWESAADAVDQPSTDVRALVSLRDGGRAVGALGARLGLTSGGATKMCRRLCGLGLVERHDVEDDLRGVQVKLTLAGRALADQAARVYADQVRRRAVGVPVPVPA